MKPFTKEQFEAFDLYNKSIIDAMVAVNTGPNQIDIEKLMEVMYEAYDTAYALLVNDSEPVNYAKADLPTYDGKPVYIYNPDTHLLVPRVWSKEEFNTIHYHYLTAETGSNLNDFQEAITKVFGGEK